MLHRLLVACLSLSAMSCLAWGQSGWSGPVEGFVFDPPTSSIRSIVGIVGAAHLGPPAISGLSAGWIAPRKQHGIAVRGDQVSLVTALGSDSPVESTLAGTAGIPEGTVWSADGSTAILYSAAGGWIQRIAHLPEAPVAGAVNDVSQLGGVLSAVAVDAAAQRIAFGIRAEAGGVYTVSGDQFPVLLMPMREPSALAYSATADVLYAADRDTGQIFEWRNAGANTPVLRREDGVIDPVALRATEDSTGRRLLYLASGADQALRVYDASSYSLLGEMALEVPPSGMEPLGETSCLLSRRAKSGDALWLLSGRPPAVYFVPAGLDSAGGQQ